MKNRILFCIYLFVISVAVPCMGQFSEEKLFETKNIRLNDSLSVAIRQITQEEHDTRKQASAHLQQKPYKVIKEYEKTRWKLGKRLKMVTTDEEYDTRELEITFKDGTKRRLNYDARTIEDYFFAYYPKLDVVVLLGEADGDYPVDLNDSSNKHFVGDPAHHYPSPDRTLRITGFYPGGAADAVMWFFEKWNKREKKYVHISDWWENNMDEYYYAEGWFWTDNDTILFKTTTYYYEMKIDIVACSD